MGSPDFRRLASASLSGFESSFQFVRTENIILDCCGRPNYRESRARKQKELACKVRWLLPDCARAAPRFYFSGDAGSWLERTRKAPLVQPKPTTFWVYPLTIWVTDVLVTTSYFSRMVWSRRKFSITTVRNL